MLTGQQIGWIFIKGVIVGKEEVIMGRMIAFKVKLRSAATGQISFKKYCVRGITNIKAAYEWAEGVMKRINEIERQRHQKCAAYVSSYYRFLGVREV